MTSPEWLESSLDGTYFDWPEPFITVEERLVGHRSKPRISAITELHGVRIGTVLGYHYPSLEPAFQDGRAVRDDAPSESVAMAKQLAGRVDYTVIREIDFEYRRSGRQPQFADLVLSPFVVTSTPVYCARIKTGTVGLAELESAQRRMAKVHVLQGIRAKYESHRR